MCISQKLLSEAAAADPRPHLRNSKGPVSPRAGEGAFSRSLWVLVMALWYFPLLPSSPLCSLFSVAGPLIWENSGRHVYLYDSDSVDVCFLIDFSS